MFTCVCLCVFQCAVIRTLAFVCVFIPNVVWLFSAVVAWGDASVRVCLAHGDELEELRINVSGSR